MNVNVSWHAVDRLRDRFGITARESAEDILIQLFEQSALAVRENEREQRRSALFRGETVYLVVKTTGRNTVTIVTVLADTHMGGARRHGLVAKTRSRRRK